MSARIITEQQNKYAKKQRRGKKTKKQVNKHGEGYGSGKYTAAQPDVGEDSDDDHLSDAPSTSILPTPTTSSTAISNDICQCCGHDEESQMYGFGLGIVSEELLDWVQCAQCEKWFHLLCVGLELEDLPEGDWYCDLC